VSIFVKIRSVVPELLPTDEIGKVICAFLQLLVAKVLSVA
jgi:hypothetical protein